MLHSCHLIGVIDVSCCPGDERIPLMSTDALRCQAESLLYQPLPVMVVLGSNWFEKPIAGMHVLFDEMLVVQLTWPSKHSCLDLEEKTSSMRMCPQKVGKGVPE